MRIQHIESFDVVGFSVRTKNVDEMEPSTAKIGALWNKFYTDAVSHLSSKTKIYGVYTNYQSDFMGSFDVIACADTLKVGILKESRKVTIEPGNYLKFSASGQMPQAVSDLWGEVWRYFNSSECSHVRSYTTDFEYYKSESDVEIFIAVN